jgi:hypothetical protein
VPAGGYVLNFYQFDGKDDNQNQVTLSGSIRQTPTRIIVTKGQIRELAVGPPLIASIDVKQIGRDKVSMNLIMTGSRGDSCTIRSPDGSSPGFQVLSSNGEVLTQGSFKYG